jgi:hypothetical protein
MNGLFVKVLAFNNNKIKSIKYELSSIQNITKVKIIGKVFEFFILTPF